MPLIQPNRSVDSSQQRNVHSYGRDDAHHNPRVGLQSRVRAAYKKRSVVYATVAAVVLIIVISISVSVSKNNIEESSSASLTTNGPVYPTVELKVSAHEANMAAFGTFLAELYGTLNLNLTALSDKASPQYKAMYWITGRDEFARYKGAQRIQRYALASFYYSTFLKAHEFLTAPTDWSSSQGWIMDTDECTTWEGVKCNTEGQVIAITLPEHHLSGSLPVELSLLTALEELDITSNFIYMEGAAHTVWLHLTNLRKLLMEDNFFVTSTGLPTEFTRLVALEKLQLSYNLLQGMLEPEVFTSMQALQHLEVESNYLSGSLPSTLGLLPDLVYLYARRNILNIEFPNMIVSGSYPSLFSLWLDNNNVTGTIPVAIGELTNLASLSVTNSSLSGPIPTQFGNLVKLRRVWLYDNELAGALPTQLGQLTQLEVFEIHDNALTGSMPSNVCDAVAGSTYEYRALTADCDSVDCDCCTACYEG